MSTSNRTTGPTKPARRWLVRLLLIVPLAWLLVLGGLADIYVRALLYPPCPTGPEQLPDYRPITIETEDGYTLRGWWHPPEEQNGVAVLLLGGNGASRDAMLPEANWLISQGYGALTIDYRSCVGGPATLGLREASDLPRLEAFARAQPGVKQVIVFGFSAGGVAAILGAEHSPNVQAIIAQGQYSNLAHEITNDGSRFPSLQWQMNTLVMLDFWLRLGVPPAQISPLTSLPRLNGRPVLLIFGEGEAENNQAWLQAQAAGANAELWIVPGAAHGGYWQAQPEEYEARLRAFLQRVTSPQP